MEAFFSLRGTLIIVLMILGVICVLIKPKIGVGVVLSLIILRAGFLFEWFPLVYKLHIPQIAIFLTLIAWLLHIGRYPLRFNTDLILLVLFFFVICASRYFFGTPIFDNDIANDFLREFLIFFLIIQVIRTPKEVRQMLWLLVGLYLFLELRAYYLYKTDYMDIALPNYQLVNRNGFANTLAAIFPLAYILGRSSKKLLFKGLGLCTALWCIIGVILTYSRAGLLALGVAMVTLLFFEKTRSGTSSLVWSLPLNVGSFP